MPKKKKTLTENQKKFNRLRAQARRNITNMQKRGYYIPNAEEIRNPKMPKRITKKYLAKMQEEVKAKNIKKQKAFVLQPKTGEVITVAEHEKRKRKEKRRKLKEIDVIIDNAMDLLEQPKPNYEQIAEILKQDVQRAIVEQGKAETAEELQRQAEAGLFEEMLEQKYERVDRGIEEMWDIKVDELTPDQKRHYRYLFIKQVEKGKINYEI